MMGTIVGVGVGLTSAVIPGLIIRGRPRQDQGRAISFYRSTRYVGFSLGGALTASILAGHTPDGHASNRTATS